jgi:hypothetical protein
MTEFNAVVEGWRDFFGLAGAASATLLGLLFVGVSFRADIRKQPAGSLHRSVVGLNFLHYLVIILFSLYFLVPDIDPNELAWSIIITSLVALSSVIRATISLRSQMSSDRETSFWNLIVPIACYAAAAGVGIAITVHDDGAIGWMVAVVAFLMIIPTRNAWELLISSSEAS